MLIYITDPDNHCNPATTQHGSPYQRHPAEIIRDTLPRYRLSADLLAAMFASIPAPLPHATTAWRQARVARLVREVAGLIPADAPQARIAAQIVIMREVTDDTFRQAGAPGLTVEQVCRLPRTASALVMSAAALERTLVRHQQRQVPLFGTELADGIEIAAIAAEEGGPGSAREGAARIPSAIPPDRTVPRGLTLTRRSPECRAPERAPNRQQARPSDRR
jgi:hypothetical protein